MSYYELLCVTMSYYPDFMEAQGHFMEAQGHLGLPVGLLGSPVGQLGLPVGLLGSPVGVGNIWPTKWPKVPRSAPERLKFQPIRDKNFLMCVGLVDGSHLFGDKNDEKKVKVNQI